MHPNSTYHGCEFHFKVVCFSKTKIGQFDVFISRHQQILGLQISMNNSMSMQKVNTSHQLFGESLNKDFIKSKIFLFYSLVLLIHAPGLFSLVVLCHQVGSNNQPNLPLNAQTPKIKLVGDPFQFDHGIHPVTFIKSK